MILCEWDAAEGHPGQSCVHLYARILSTSFTSVSILSVCCYSIVSISMIRISEFLAQNVRSCLGQDNRILDVVNIDDSPI
jgi:hypothetical protein